MLDNGGSDASPCGPITHAGSVVGYARLLRFYAAHPVLDIWIGRRSRSTPLVLSSLRCAVIAPLSCIPIARRALKPVTDLERGIRKRDAKDKSKLARFIRMTSC